MGFRSLTFGISAAMTAALKRLAVGTALVMALLALALHVYHPALLALQSALEHRFGPAVLRDSERIAGIVVLGGNVSRILEAARLGAKFPGVPVILSGADLGEQAAASARASLEGRIVFDGRPQNTFENALFSKELAQGGQVGRWLLVTSTLHMPRAMGVFRAVGFAVEPWPVADGTGLAKDRAALVLHELIGLVAYRLLGRSQSFFPGPLP